MTEKKKKKEKQVVYWGKGPRTETVEYGEAKFTIRGLTYREFCYVAGLNASEGDIMSFRMCLTDVENLLALNEDGSTEEIKMEWEQIDIDGKDTRILSESSFNVFDEAPLLVGQILHVIKELSRLTPEEARTARIFRKNK